MGRTTSPRAMAKGAPATLAARLSAARAQGFVGRAAELDLLRDALAAEVPPFAVLHLHGPGGVGKTTLLARYAREARATGREVVVLDGHAVEASAEAYMAALAAALGVDEPEAALAAFARSTRPVLILDTYEALTPLDAWLRERFLPQLPAGALVVIAGRRPPLTGWREDAGWNELLRVVGLRNLDPEASRALLAARGVPPSLHDSVLRFTGGHPLALTLMADVVAEQGAEAALAPERSVDVVRELVDRFVRQIPDEDHRRALEVCAIARTTTETLLRDLLPEARAAEMLDWLCDLSFVELGPEGAFPHDLARESLDAELRWRDPERYLDLNMRIIGWCAERVGRSTGRERQRAHLDLLHVQFRNPALRPFIRLDATRETWLERAGAADRDAVLAMARAAEGDDSAAVVEHWLGRAEAEFMLFRSASIRRPRATR